MEGYKQSTEEVARNTMAAMALPGHGGSLETLLRCDETLPLDELSWPTSNVRGSVTICNSKIVCRTKHDAHAFDGLLNPSG
tara:strand:+ start:1458 stop:1700 length:243 start_codon:yes stop_codon:yes gene_type:complete